MSIIADPCKIFVDSTKPAEIGPNYAYLVIRIFPDNVPTHLAILCHFGETNDILFLGGLVQLSTGNKTSTIQTFLLKQLRNFLDSTSRLTNLAKCMCIENTMFLISINLLTILFRSRMRVSVISLTSLEILGGICYCF